LAARLASPLDDLPAIRARLDAVAALREDKPRRARLRAALKGAPDMARALARLSLDRFAPRDLGAIRDGLARAESMAAALDDAQAGPPIPPLLAAARAAAPHGARV
jgi:DNA mismatch repair protein MutS